MSQSASRNVPFRHEERQGFRVQEQAENPFDRAILLPPAAFVVATRETEECIFALHFASR